MANIDLDALFLSSLSAAGLPSKGYMNLMHLKQVAGVFFCKIVGLSEGM